MDFNVLKKTADTILPGASEEDISLFEREFGKSFPADYQELLKFSDGCMLKEPTFVIFFSCGKGFHEKETLSFANSLLGDVGMFFIGRFAGEMFGYLKNSDDQRIYSYFEETGEKTLIAENINDFVQQYLVAPPKKKKWYSFLFS